MSDDCPCKALPSKGDTQASLVADTGGVAGVKLARARRPKQLRGAHCVVSKKSGKAFNCSDSEEKAHRLARALGDRFEVRSSRGKPRG